MHPDWSLDATLYELNTRQFTEAGTFGAAEAHLPRLAGLGVDIIWLMPIHPIGEKNRKGSLGSPYSVRDYFGVNPEFGTLDDLKRFIAAAHALGMHVILDWVANHTAWDNPLVAEHPEWYARDAAGQLRSTPWWDWSDVVDLDFGQPGLRRYMLEAMSYWVREADIDGFRCDVAGYVPGDFWDAARSVLDAIRPVFMLAEWEARDLHDAGVRRDVRLDLERRATRDHTRRRRHDRARPLLLVAREGLATRSDAHDVHRQPRHELVEGHAIRALRQRPARGDRTLGRG